MARKFAVVDSSVAIHLLSSKPESAIVHAKVAKLGKSHELIVPTLVLAELAYAHDAPFDEIMKIAEVTSSSFDMSAAEQVRAAIRSAIDGRTKRQNPSKNEVKVDAMIAANAIAIGAEYLLATDGDFSSYLRNSGVKHLNPSKPEVGDQVPLPSVIPPSQRR